MSLCQKVAGLLLGMALLSAVALAQNDDIPLGDVARQQSGQKATHSFDDDNFQRSAPPPAAEAKSGDAAKPEAGVKEAGDKGGDKAEAAPSQDDVKALEKQLADLKQSRDTNTTQIGRLQSKIDGTDLTDDMRQSLADAQGAYKERLDAINAQIPVLEKKLDAARAAQKSSEAGAGDDSSKPEEAKPEDSAKAK